MNIKSLLVHLSCLVIFISGCSPKHVHNAKTKASKKVFFESCECKPDTVSLFGNFDIKIINSKNAKPISFSSKDGNYWNDLKIQERHNGLHVLQDVAENRIINENLPITINMYNKKSLELVGDGNIRVHSMPQHISLKVQSNNFVNVKGQIKLCQLDLHGTGKVNFTNVKSDNLSINMYDSVVTKIEGQVSIRQLYMSGRSWLRVFWNDSSYLIVKGTDNTFAQIAGKVNTLDVELNKCAQLNGKFLRSKESYVKTHDESRADIYAKCSSDSIAEDSSNIYTYRGPDYKDENMYLSGSVLDMRKLG